MATRLGVESMAMQSQVRQPNRWTAKPPCWQYIDVVIAVVMYSPRSCHRTCWRVRSWWLRTWEHTCCLMAGMKA